MPGSLLHEIVTVPEKVSATAGAGGDASVLIAWSMLGTPIRKTRFVSAGETVIVPLRVCVRATPSHHSFSVLAALPVCEVGVMVPVTVWRVPSDTWKR